MSVEPMQLSDQPIGKLYRGKNNLCFSFSIPESMDCHKVVTAVEKSLCVCKCAAGAYVFAFEIYAKCESILFETHKPFWLNSPSVEFDLNNIQS